MFDTRPLQIAAIAMFVSIMALYSLPRAHEHSVKQTKIEQENVHVSRR